ncbi:TPA: hypothetical protein ACQVH3_003734 [Serratia marcescens]
MNKLSELSKPVAQIYYDEHDSSVMRIGWFRSDEPKNPAPLYSQECVSALLAELEAKDRRIAELEAKLATPVRLPVVLMGYQSDDYRIGFMEGVEKSGEEVRAAGFTVEDKQ